MTGPERRVGVAALVALKTGALVKSRLAGLPDPLRRRWAWTMAVDTLTALADVVETVCVVSAEPGLPARLDRVGLAGVEVLGEPRRAGMNSALREGAAYLQRQGHPSVLACVGDLPALRPASVRAVLAAAAAHERAFLADASGVGTTMLHTRGAALQPCFQGSSAAAHHASGAVALSEDLLGGRAPDARRDVDTEADLAAAVRLGLGRASAALVAPGTPGPAGYALLEVRTRPDPDGWAVTSTGDRVELPGAALAPELAPPRPGQRVHAVLAGGRVLSAWS